MIKSSKRYFSSVCFTGGRWASHVSKHKIEQYIERNNSSNLPTSKCDSLFIESIRSRRSWIVKRLLSKRNYTIPQFQLFSAQHLAYRLGHFEILNETLSDGRAGKSSGLLDSARLMKIACVGKANTVAVMLQNGAKVGTKFLRLQTSELVCAMSKKYKATALAILTFGNLSTTYLNQRDESGMTAFYRTLMDWKRFGRVLAKLLKIGVDVNQRFPFSTYDTPLTMSARYQASPSVVASLLDSGAQIDAADSVGNTALHIACFYNMTSVIDLLLKRGANLLIPNGNFLLAFGFALFTHSSIKNLELLLRHGASVNERGKDYKTALYVAVWVKSSPEVVDFLLSRGADVNFEAKYKENALMVASWSDLPDIARLLIDHGANVNAGNWINETALTLSARWGNYRVANLLLEKGANVNARNIQGYSSLTYAGVLGFNNIAELLIQRGANVNISDNEGTSVLSAFSAADNLECVKLLLRHGSDIAAVNRLGETALMLSIDYNASLAIMQILIASGVDINAVSSDNKTAMLLAIRNNRIDAVNLLISHGAKVNTYVGWSTPLMEAVEGNKTLAIVKVLLENGANVNDIEGEFGKSVLMLACQNSGASVVELLLEHGADASLRNIIDNRTALHYAASYSSVAILRLLINKTSTYAQINDGDANGYTPLMYAARTNRTNVLLSLLQYGANVNATATNGWTALMFAASNNQTGNVKTILDYWANVNAKALMGDNMTALIAAMSVGSNNDEMVRVLLEHGATLDDRYHDMTVLMLAIEQNVKPPIIQMLIKFGANVNATTIDGKTAWSIAQQKSRTDVIDVLKENGALKGGVAPSNVAETAAEYPFSIIKSPGRTNYKTRRIALFSLFSGFYEESSDSPNSQRCLLEIVKNYLNGVNVRSDVLPDYSLEVHYYDGKIENVVLPQLLDNFIALSQNNSPSSLMISPVILGPRMQCSLWNRFYESEGNALRLIQRMNQLGNVYVEYCSDRLSQVRLPPLFQSGVVNAADNETDVTMVMAVIGFAKSIDWKHISLICLIDKGDPAVLAEKVPRFHRLFLTNSIDVNGLHIGETFNAIFTEIKLNPRERILFIANDNFTCLQCIDLFCSSYKAGIRPDRYAVLMVQSDCLKCNGAMVNEGAKQLNCSRTIQQSQMGMFFFGITLASMDADTPAPTFAKFRIFFTSIQETAKKEYFVDQKCTPGYWQPINDSFMAAVYLLHNTEVKLKAQYKTNLFELMTDGRNRSARSLIEHTMAEVASDAELAFYGAKQTGMIVQANFDSKRMVADSLKQDFEWRILTKMVGKSGRALDGKFESYKMDTAQTVLWATTNGRPPKDLSIISRRNGSYNETSFLSVSIVSLILSITQVMFVLKARRRSSKQTKTLFFDQTNSQVLIIGCLLMNISAAILLAGTEYFPRKLCLFLPLFIVSSLTFMNASFFAKMLSMAKFAHENRYISRKYRKPNLFNPEFHETQRRVNIYNVQKKTRIALAAIAFATAFLQALWLSSDPMRLRSSTEYENDPIFDTDSETYYVIEIEWCDSLTRTYWIAFFTAFQALLLGSSVVMGLTLKQKFKFVRKQFKSDFVHLRMAINNSATILVFTSFLMVVIPSRPASIFFMKTLAFAACLLLYSSSNSGIVFFPIWYSLLAPREFISRFLQKRRVNSNRLRLLGSVRRTLQVATVSNNDNNNHVRKPSADGGKFTD